MALQYPQPLAAHHVNVAFDYGDDSLNHWLQRRALSHQRSGASRIFVVVDDVCTVKAVVALAPGTIAVASPPAAFSPTCPIRSRWSCWRVWLYAAATPWWCGLRMWRQVLRPHLEEGGV